jgi:hypothetical protein
MDQKFADSLRFARKHQSHHAFLRLVTADNINLRDKDGCSPFYLFVAYGAENIDSEDLANEIKVMKHLLALKANVNNQSSNGRTPLYEAVRRQVVPVVTFLLENKADMRIGAECMISPIRLVCIKEDFPIARLFMMCGAKLEEFENQNISPIVRLDGPNEEMKQFAARIETAGKSVLAFLSLSKKSQLLKIVGRDVVKYIARLIWETRGRPEWNQN